MLGRGDWAREKEKRGGFRERGGTGSGEKIGREGENGMRERGKEKG